MTLPADLFCILGPSNGYNREVLLFRPPSDDDTSEWRMPSSDVACQLLRWLGMSDPTFQELKDLGERRAAASFDAPMLRLRCVLLSKRRFAELEARMKERSVSVFKIFTHREVTAKGAKTDWHTLVAMLYLLDHLDR